MAERTLPALTLPKHASAVTRRAVFGAAGAMVVTRPFAVAAQPNAARPADAAVSPTFVAFISEGYLNPKIETAEDIARLYSARVDYYGRSASRAQVIADKQIYYRRWPERLYDLDAATIKVTPRAGATDIADVSFEYGFRVAAPSGQSRSGRGRSRLGLTAVDGQIIVIAESGEILRRN